ENVLVENVIAGCFLLIGLAIPLYNFILLFYYKANTIFDGVLFVILGTAVCMLILIPLKQLTEDYNIGVSPIDFYFCIIEFVFENNMTPWNIMMLVGYILFGLAIVGYFYWFSKKDCSIRTNEKCEGIFGYKVFLPLLNLGILMFILMPYGIKEFRVEYFLLITLGMFIFFGIYNRNPKFSKSSYIEFGVMTGINLLLVLIAVLS
ncbi:MAG: hypothetical protein K2N65_06240, partial [Anaeroplasmataceae bacterium]|nr:hypothetical protein [Anaeroplasmataceae bacterium]